MITFLYIIAPVHLMFAVFGALGFVYGIIALLGERPPKYTDNYDAEHRTWELIAVNNKGNLWSLWQSHEENRYSALIFHKEGACEGHGVFDHYGGNYKVHDGKIDITIAGNQYLNISVKKSGNDFVSTTITDSHGNIDDADFKILKFD